MVYFLFVGAALEDSEANPPSNSIINLLPVLVCVYIYIYKCDIEERFTFRNRKYSESKKKIKTIFTQGQRGEFFKYICIVKKTVLFPWNRKTRFEIKYIK